MENEQKEALLAELEKKAEAARSILAESYQIFAQEYAVDNNGVRSAISAGYTEKGAGVQAHRLLKNVKVMAYISAINKLHCYKKGVNKDEQIWRMQAIADAQIDSYFKWNEKKGILVFKGFDHLTQEQKYAIESIKQGKNGLELKLTGKLPTIEMLNKNIGFYEKDNAQKGEAIAAGVAVLLPDNTRGKVVANPSEKVTE